MHLFFFNDRMIQQCSKFFHAVSDKIRFFKRRGISLTAVSDGGSAKYLLPEIRRIQTFPPGGSFCFN